MTEDAAGLQGIETGQAIAHLLSGNAFPVAFAIMVLYNAGSVRVPKFKNTAAPLSVVGIYLKCMCVYRFHLWVNVISLTRLKLLEDMERKRQIRQDP